MIRIMHVVAIAALIGSAGYAYSIKYESIVHAEELARLQAQVDREREALAVLRAEWTLLNRPDRVQALADIHLDDIVATDPRRIVRFSDLPESGERDDGIARKLQALGLSAPTAKPGRTASPSVPTPTTTGSTR